MAAGLLRNAIALAISIAVTAIAAAIGGVASIDSPEFYRELAKPSWAPPASVFGPVWTTLYLMMAIAAWLVWRAGAPGGTRTALVLYVVQLALNALWTWLFFRWRSGAGASVEIVILWIVIAATVWTFWRIRPLAGVLLLPYWAWVSFATMLTLTVWRMNPRVL